MRFFTFLFLIISFAANAQNTCTAPGQSPASAIPACVTAALSQPSVSGCDNGLVFVPTCSNDGSGTVYTAVNPYWYSFTCYQSGTLAFSILPVSTADDYDWQLYDVTGINTNNLTFLTNSSLVVAANWSGFTGATGATGASGAGSSAFVCASSTLSPFSTKPNLIIGHDYLLLVSNFSPSGLGYALSFGGNTGGTSGSTAVLIDASEPPIPLLASATSLCGTAVKIKTNKKVKCNTLAANGSDFSVVAPDGVTIINPISASAINCTTGLVFDSVIINMGTLLAPGVYKVRIKNGTDGNTLRDKCDNLIPVNDEVTFVVSPLPTAPIVSSPVSFCQNIAGTQLTATGTGLLWYTTATGGTGAATAPTPATTATGSTIYYVSQTISGCESPRAAITVNINAAPAAPAVTTPIAYCQNITANALTAPGTGLLWYTTATSVPGSATAPTPITTASGAFNFYVSQTVSGCQSVRAQIVVNVNATPAAPGVTTPVTICQGAAATGLAATGTGLLWYAAATGGTGTITIPFPPTGSMGTNTYYVSQTVNNCESPRAAIVVNVVALPAAPTASSPITYCQGNAATALTAGLPGASLLWYTVATGGTGSTTAPTPSTTMATSTTYYVSQTVGTCESQRTAILVIIKATPAAPTATTPVTYCQNTTASALTATGTFLLWYSLPTGTGVGSTTAPTPSTTAGGSTIYYVTQTVNGCESNPRTGITVNVTATPAAPTATTPVTYCQNTTASALTATGTNLLWYTVPTAGTGSATAPVPSTTNAGSTTYYVSQSTGVCEGPRFAIVVNITAEPLAPLVSTPVTYCQNATATALTATGINLLWYNVATGGTGTATASLPSTTTVGSTVYYVSQSTTCVSPRAAITVVIKATPLAPVVTTPVAYCQNATPTILTATGTSLLWYTTATGGTGSTTAPTPSTTTGGITTYYVSQTINGCESPRAAIVINVTATPAAPTVNSPLNICQGTTAPALTATAATGASLLWYTLATSGTGTATAPILSTTSLGSTNYYVSQTLNGCEGPRALITVTVNSTPAAPTLTAPTPYCQGATAMALTATGTNLLWYTSATGGMGVATAPTPATTTVGNIIYYVSQTTGVCEGPRATITVTTNITPAAPTATATVNYCQGATASALTAGSTNLLWYTTATLGMGVATAPTPLTNTAGSTSYYVSQTTGICEGPRKQITVVVTAIPAAPTVSTVVYCQGATAVALTAGGTNLLWYTTATLGTGNATAPIPLTNTTGNTTYYVSQSANNCEGPRVAIVVTVNATPAAPNVTTPVLYCQNATTMPLAAVGTNLQWYANATGGIASTIAPPPSSVTAGTFTFYVAEKLGNCEGPRAAIIVNITATPTAPIVNTPQNLCPNIIALPLAATGTNLLWYTTATGGFGSTIAPIPNTSISPATYNYYVSQSTPVSTGSCAGPRANIVVNISNVVNVNVGRDSTICEEQSVKLFPVVTPAGATYEWRAIGVPLNTIDSLFSKDVTVNPKDTATYILKATLGGCFKEDTVNINVIWKPKIDAGLTKAICLDSSILLKGIITRKSNDSINYVWSPIDSLATPDALQTLAYPTKTTLYTISFQTKPTYGCDFKGSSSVKLVVQKIDNPFAGNDTIAMKGLPHQLHGSGGLNYTWTSPSGINITSPFSADAFVTLNNDAQFYLKVTDAIGCEGRDTVFIKVYEGPTYYIPNAFTPNGDGLNEIFRAIPVGMSNTTYFRIFNRNGQLMFETNQWLKGWDGTFKGKPQPNGAYIWMVAGTSKYNRKVEMKGTVMLIR
jgi:gliding motility-associated-like protein